MQIVRFARVGPETARAGLIHGAERRKMVFRFFHLMYFFCMFLDVNPGFFEVMDILSLRVRILGTAKLNWSHR